MDPFLTFLIEHTTVVIMAVVGFVGGLVVLIELKSRRIRKEREAEARRRLMAESVNTPPEPVLPIVNSPAASVFSEPNPAVGSSIPAPPAAKTLEEIIADRIAERIGSTEVSFVFSLPPDAEFEMLGRKWKVNRGTVVVGATKRQEKAKEEEKEPTFEDYRELFREG